MVKESMPPRGAVKQRARPASIVILLCLAAGATAPMGAVAAPYFAAPAAVPGTIEAERFDRGGEGPGYHELTPANTGGEFRPQEGVDIRADPRAPRDNWIVTNFETDEWLAYTIDVAASGQYQWGLRASTPFGNASYYLQIDGQNVTGPVAVPNTGNWDAFQWAPAPNVFLSQGRHLLRVVSNRQYFDFDLIVILAVPAPPPPAAGVNFACAFNALPDCGFVEQAKVPGRATLTTISRDGGTALRLHTEPGDNNVVGSGAMERDDVYLAKPGTADPEVYGEGVEQWWAHSIYFPNDFTVPTSYQGYNVFDFHNSGNGGQANFHVAFAPWEDVAHPGLLRFIGYGGDGNNPAAGAYEAVIGQVQKNVWYDFVYHVRWSSGPDGFFDAWVNGKHVLARRGPTLYAGQGVYLKLANYHVPVCEPYPTCIGSHPASSVIHDRVVRGNSAAAVALGPLDN